MLLADCVSAIRLENAALLRKGPAFPGQVAVEGTFSSQRLRPRTSGAV